MTDDSKQISLYKLMVLINQIEEKIAEEYDNNEIHTPIHLSVGQEAISVGICSHLMQKDFVFSTHRSHAHRSGRILSREALHFLFFSTTKKRF